MNKPYNNKYNVKRVSTGVIDTGDATTNCAFEIYTDITVIS